MFGSNAAVFTALPLVLSSFVRLSRKQPSIFDKQDKLNATMPTTNIIEGSAMITKGIDKFNNSGKIQRGMMPTNMPFNALIKILSVCKFKK